MITKHFLVRKNFFFFEEPDFIVAIISKEIYKNGKALIKNFHCKGQTARNSIEFMVDSHDVLLHTSSAKPDSAKPEIWWY